MNLDNYALLDALDIGLIVVNNETKILLWNDWMVKHSSVSQASALNQKLNAIFRDENAKKLHRAVEHTLKYRTSSVLSAALHRSTLPLYNLYDVSPRQRIYQSITTTGLFVTDSEPRCLIQIIDASTSIKREKVLREYSDNLKKEAVTDGLTGLYNRRFFDEVYAKALGSSKREKQTLSIFMIDIDFFKLYNDFYGHGAGDVVIQSVASAMKSQLKRPEDTLARYGGEEFVVILPHTERAAAEIVADKLNQVVRDLNIQHEKSGVAPFVTISIGICSGIPTNNENMLLKADEALYESKHGGRNRWSSMSL